MKKSYSILLSVIISLTVITAVQADYTEKVQVIKTNKNNHDLIIERSNGERLLIQHSYHCSSMSTEFPVFLLWNKNNIKKVKVAINEMCKVYNWGRYSDIVTIKNRIKSPSHLIKDHLAEIEWNKKIYKIDYGDGCEELRYHQNQTAYINIEEELAGGTLYLPRNRGMCIIKSSELLEDSEFVTSTIQTPIKNITFKAENNKSYFYWDKLDNDGDWLYLISRSRFEIDPSDYSYKEMPFIRFTRKNAFTAKSLANNRKYYFYFSAMNKNGDIAPWTKIEVIPKRTIRSFHNNPDLEEFEIELKERTDEYFLLSWPDKSKESKKYLIQLFVNGKRKFLKIVDGSFNEWKVPILDEYQGGKFRFTIRSIPKVRYGAKYSDGIYWEDVVDS